MDSMKRPVVLITFSGIDGAGKSTQIDLLSANMTAAGARIVRLSFFGTTLSFGRPCENAPPIGSSEGKRALAHPIGRWPAATRT